MVSPPFAAELTSIPKPGGWQQRLPHPIPTANFVLCGSHIAYSPTNPAWSWKLQHPAGLGQSRGSGRQQGAAAPGKPKPWRRAARAGLDPLNPPRSPPVPQCSPRSAPARWRPWPGLCPPRVLAAEWLQYGHRRARPAAGRGGTGRDGAGGNRGESGEGPGGATAPSRAPWGRGSGLGQAREGPEPPRRGPGPGRGASP